MSSIFFQITPNDFLEAARVYNGTGKEFAIRIVSQKNGKLHFVYLPEVTLSELSLLVSIFRARIVQNMYSVNNLQRQLYDIYY